ncbi:hypothetical protein TYRP_002841 [Tyrophagus putrescentiae]|nr:hypothetical protein TYRP_002841 [Tyrophagus putrescentiae]
MWRTRGRIRERISSGHRRHRRRRRRRQKRRFHPSAAPKPKGAKGCHRLHKLCLPACSDSQPLRQASSSSRSICTGVDTAAAA